MQVKELLKSKQRDTITATSSTELLEAMRLLIDHKISCLPVLGATGELIGIVSDKDIFKAVFENRPDFKKFSVGDLMTTDLIVGLGDDDVNYIAGLMTENRIRHVPIVEKDKLIGLISQADVVKTQMEHIEVENRYLKLYIDGKYPT